MIPIEQSAMYQALMEIGVDVEIEREATEEYRDRTKISADVTTSAIYRALCSNGKVNIELARKAVEEIRDMPDSWKWKQP